MYRSDAFLSRARMGALLGGLLLIAFAAPLHAAVEYDFVYVDAFQPDYDLREAYLLDLNNSGEGCGWATDLPTYAGYWWSQSGDKVRLPWSYVRAINDWGQITGYDQVFDRATGTATTIPVAPGAVARPIALDINDRGVVVGYDETCNCSNSDHVLQIPFVWDATGGVRTIAVPGAKELVKINDANVAVGNIRGGSPNGFVYELATGRTVLLEGFFAPTPYPWTEAAAINDLGMVTGIHRSADATTFGGFVWTEAAGATLLPHFGNQLDLNVRPAAINQGGAVVGRAEVSHQAWRAFIWDGTRGLRDLNALVTLPANFILDRALAINDRGWIAGDGHFGPTWSSSQAFVLIPRTESTTGVPSFPPGRFDLSVAPNPATGSVVVQFAVPTTAAATIRIFDLNGRRVATVLDATVSAGRSMRWEGRDDDGRLVPSGTYLVRLESGGRSVTRRLAVVR